MRHGFLLYPHRNHTDWRSGDKLIIRVFFWSAVR